MNVFWQTGYKVKANRNGYQKEYNIKNCKVVLVEQREREKIKECAQVSEQLAEKK